MVLPDLSQQKKEWKGWEQEREGCQAVRELDQ